jgi:hypothetical protein
MVLFVDWINLTVVIVSVKLRFILPLINNYNYRWFVIKHQKLILIGIHTFTIYHSHF